MTSKSPLIPELHGEADNIVSFGAQHGRDGGGVDSSGHGDGNGLVVTTTHLANDFSGL
jgi:hypothetical protein